MMTHTYGTVLTFCEACKLNYDATRRKAECPHVSTVGESSYLAKLRELGPPYKIEDRPKPKEAA